MKLRNSFLFVLVSFFLFGCATFQAAGDVQTGREALIIGQNEEALSDFQRAAKIDPTYVAGATLPEGVWSYLGRAEYATGHLTQARRSLERALANNKNDNLARLYLGLTLARAGDRQRGLREIDRGLKGLDDWINYVNDAFRFSYGQYWDPAGKIRWEIESDLAMISRKYLDWPRLIASGEHVGRKVEEEKDLVRRDEWRDMSRDGDGIER